MYERYPTLYKKSKEKPKDALTAEYTFSPLTVIIKYW